MYFLFLNYNLEITSGFTILLLTVRFNVLFISWMSLLFSYRMPDKSKKLPYDESQVIAAIAAVKNGSSFNAAAIKHGVPLLVFEKQQFFFKRCFLLLKKNGFLSRFCFFSVFFQKFLFNEFISLLKVVWV